VQVGTRNGMEIDVCDEKPLACDGRCCAGGEMWARAATCDRMQMQGPTISINLENQPRPSSVINSL
jgi:hypothetical protein